MPLCHDFCTVNRPSVPISSNNSSYGWLLVVNLIGSCVSSGEQCDSWPSGSGGFRLSEISEPNEMAMVLVNSGEKIRWKVGYAKMTFKACKKSSMSHWVCMAEMAWVIDGHHVLPTLLPIAENLLEQGTAACSFI